MSCFLLWHFQLENPNNLLSPRFAVTANLPFTRRVELCCAGSNCWCWCWMTTFTTFRGNCQLAIHLSLSAIHDFALFVYDFLFRASFCHLMLFNYSRSYKKKTFVHLPSLRTTKHRLKELSSNLFKLKINMQINTQELTAMEKLKCQSNVAFGLMLFRMFEKWKYPLFFPSTIHLKPAHLISLLTYFALIAFEYISLSY